jgi:hypothetical protein
MFRNKKAAVDDFIELVGYVFILAIVTFLILSFYKIRGTRVIEDVSELKKASYANNILIQYLDSDASSCISSSTITEAALLKNRGSLSYSDLINIIFIGKLEATSSYADMIYYLFADQDEPFDKYHEIWNTCTENFFNSRGLENYKINIYSGDTEIFSQAFGPISKALVAGQAELPNFADKEQTIQIYIYETIPLS